MEDILPVIFMNTTFIYGGIEYVTVNMTPKKMVLILIIAVISIIGLKLLVRDKER